MENRNGATSPYPMLDVQRNRLPTLWEVLSRRTLPPVDLFSFYIFMRDQQRSVDFLDFWLDISQHMSLCRHYVRNMRMSNMIATPEGEKSQSKRSSQLLDQIGDMDHPPAGPSMYSTEQEKNTDAQMSLFLREHANERNMAQPQMGHSPQGSFGSNHSAARYTSSQDRNHQSVPNSPMVITDSNSPEEGAVVKEDLERSAEKILYTYLLAGAEREIILGNGIAARVTELVEEERRYDPEVFDAAKDYVFQAMERDAFPNFLRQKALGNLLPSSKTLRLIVGLISMFAGFWAAFCMVFLDYARLERLYLLIPFTVGIYFLMTYLYALDPILAFIGYSEYTLFHFNRVKEPYVRRLLNKRAVTVLGLIVLLDAALCILFIFVPGKRL